MRGFASMMGLLLIVSCAHAADDPASFDGEWRTSIGVVTLKQTGKDVTGTYGNAGQFTLKGAVAGKALTFEYQEGQAKGDARWTLDDTGNAFEGGFQVRGGRAGGWDGWRPDPKAESASKASFAGLWLTNIGLMELEQTGDEVKGRYAIRGTSEVTGQIKGRRLEYRYKGFQGGKGWFDLSADGKTLSGAASGDGTFNWYGWHGRPAPEFARHAPLVAGKGVDGSTKNLLTYYVRAPEGYSAKGDKNKKWPAVLILHGSNMNAKSYVETIASAWPDLAKDFLLIGINGETASNTGPDPRFNYSYVNYVGRSTFRGFPGTDRESPALVAEAMTELKEVYPIDHYLVGGHSQGGFLTYSLLMNAPELIAGAFPISCGVIFQCEPSAYADEKLRAAQRDVPLAIIHGKTDPVVDFGMGRYAADLFGEASWPAFRFLADDSGAHMFARLPVGEAIRWLESLNAKSQSELARFGQDRIKKEAYRDAIAAVRRARAVKGQYDKRLDSLSRQIDAKAQAGVKEFLPKLRDKKGGKWVDAFLAYRDQFEFADGAREAMTAFNGLRKEHEEPAKNAQNEARAAFQKGERDAGYAKYQEIVDKYYASSNYRTVKRWLAERK